MKSAVKVNAGFPALGRTSILVLAASAGFLWVVFANQGLVLMAGALVVIGCVPLMLRWPETGTLIVLFAIYSNIGVLAMRSPKAIQAAAGSPGQNPRIALVLATLFILLSISLLYRTLVCREQLIFDRGFVLMLVFLVALLGSSVFARDRNLVLSELSDYFVEGLVLYFLLSNAIRDFTTLRRATWVVLVAGSFMASLSVLQRVTHTPQNTYGGLAQVTSDFHSDVRMPHVAERVPSASQVSENGEIAGEVRAAGPIGETNRYGEILVVLLPLAALQFATERSRRLRILAVMAGGLILGGLLLTLSRGNLLAALATFAFAACLRLVKPHQVFGMAIATALLVSLFQPDVMSRMTTLGRIKLLFSESRNAEVPDSSAVRRYVENVAAWQVFLDHPFLGVGPGHFAAFYSNNYGNRLGLVEQTKNYRGHNLYLETLAETGVVGFASFAAILAGVAWGLWKERARSLRSNPQLACVATAFLISLGAYAVSAIFDHLSYQRYFWLLLALAAAAIRIIRAEREHQSGEALCCA